MVAKHKTGTSINLSKHDTAVIDAMFPGVRSRSEKIRLAIHLAKNLTEQNRDRLNIIVL